MTMTRPVLAAALMKRAGAYGHHADAIAESMLSEGGLDRAIRGVCFFPERHRQIRIHLAAINFDLPEEQIEWLVNNEGSTK